MPSGFSLKSGISIALSLGLMAVYFFMTRWLIRRFIAPLIRSLLSSLRQASTSEKLLVAAVLFFTWPALIAVLGGLLVLYLAPLIVGLYFTLLGPWIFGY